jgi:hypothetical protein
MSKILDISNFIGIIKPGDIYILIEDESPGADPGPIEYLYTIRSIEEIAPAVQMVMEIVLAEMYEYKQFLGVSKKNCGVYQIKLLCHDRTAEEDVNFSLYLHRIQTFEENLCEVRRNFGIS